MFGFTSIRNYHQELSEGKISCEEVVKHYLKQIELHRNLNAFTAVFEEEALERARELDRKRAQGHAMEKLHGVVVGIKDVICYENHPVTAASAILSGYEAIYSATAVTRLLEEGAIIIGNLNCDEFAMGSTNENSNYGPVLNALDHSRVPGGSSGGSAVAVQSGCCMISLGSDTGGSVRQPADFCGIIGLKPGYGRISRYGLIAYASSFDQIGIFSTNVEDAALALEVMAGADAFDSTVSSAPVPEYHKQLGSDQTPLKIAYLPETLEHPGLDPEIRTAISDLLNRLRADGHTVDAVEFPYLDYIVPAYYVLTTAEASSNLSRYDGVRYGHRTEKAEDLLSFYKKTRSEGFGKEVKKRILLGTFVLSAGYYDAYFTKAQQVRRLLADKTRAIFSGYNAILLPTAPTPAFKIGEKIADPIAMYLADIYTVYANLVGVPAISIPLFRHTNGMPFGLQIMTNQNEELSLLRISRQLMARYSNNIQNGNPQ